MRIHADPDPSQTYQLIVPCSWLRVRFRIPNTDPDPGQPKSMRIHADPGPQHWFPAFATFEDIVMQS
jgi:hypothetical protein